MTIGFPNGNYWVELTSCLYKSREGNKKNSELILIYPKGKAAKRFESSSRVVLLIVWGSLHITVATFRVSRWGFCSWKRNWEHGLCFVLGVYAFRSFPIRTTNVTQPSCIYWDFWLKAVLSTSQPSDESLQPPLYWAALYFSSKHSYLHRSISYRTIWK